MVLAGSNSRHNCVAYFGRSNTNISMATLCALCLFDNKNWSRFLVYLSMVQCCVFTVRLSYTFYKSVYDFGQSPQMIILDILFNPFPPPDQSNYFRPS